MDMHYTNDELVTRLWDKENIKDLMARRALYMTNGCRRDELSDLWVKTDANRRTASYANNRGYYTGLDEIARHCVQEHEELRRGRLEKRGICLAENGPGLGEMEIHTISTPLIELADDGRTAKYMGYDNGLIAEIAPDGGCESYFIKGLVFADLIKENGQWKIWHLMYTHDHSIATDKSYVGTPTYQEPEDDPYAMRFGEPTLPKQVYESLYGWIHMPVRMPKPHYSFEAENSYGPEGHIEFYDDRGRSGKCE